jgi:hypothetical protein
MDTRKGGHRYCPSCKQIVETRVLLEGYCQTEIHGISVHAVVGSADFDGLDKLIPNVVADNDMFLTAFRQVQEQIAHGKK